MEISISPIGVIKTPFEKKEDTPIQGVFAPEASGVVELDEKFAEGLKDIDGFTHIHLIYYFDRASEAPLVKCGFLDDEPHGIFAMRSPSRVNGIGMTTVKLERVDGCKLHVSGVDMLSGTPLIDIKPYISRFDSFPDASEGWVAGKQNRPKPEGRE